MAFDSYIIDVLEVAFNRLAAQFKTSTTGVIPLLEAFTRESQDFNDTNLTVLNGRDLDTAIGIQLDIIGVLIGQKRPFDSLGVLATDEVYLRFIKAKIFKNQVTGGSDPEIMQAALIALDTQISVFSDNSELLAIVISAESGVADDVVEQLLFFESTPQVNRSYFLPVPDCTRISRFEYGGSELLKWNTVGKWNTEGTWSVGFNLP